LKAATGSADQVFSDRPLWFDDKFHTVASVSVSYWLIDALTSNVIVGGVAKGSAQLIMKVGERFVIELGST
jgi:hypothetical protein